MHTTSSTTTAPASATNTVAAPAVTERLIFDVVKRTGLDFGVVSNVLFAARTLTAEALPA